MEQPDFFNYSTYLNNGSKLEEFELDTLNLPMIVDIDTSEAATGPWGKYFYEVANKSRLGVNLNKIRFEAAMPPEDNKFPEFIDRVQKNRAEYLDKGYRYDPNKEDFLLDSILIGTVELKSALLDYNPLFYLRQSTKITLKQYRDFQNYDRAPEFYPEFDTLRWKFITTIDSNDNEVQAKVSVDSIFYLSSAVPIRDAGEDKFLIDFSVMTLDAENIKKIMSDAEHLKHVNDEIYEYIKQGKAKVTFPTFREVTYFDAIKKDSVTGEAYTELDSNVFFVDFHQSKRIREKVIPDYMAKITNNREFIDLGDNGDGIFYYDEDPARTERMINNVDYYYRLISFDEGDYQQPTEVKHNDASLALPNEVKVRPKAAALTEDITFDIEVATPNKIGGLYNFEFIALDPQRVSQFYADHVLELEFKPYWTLGSVTFTGRDEPAYFGKYGRIMTLTDSTTGQLLYESLTEFENDPGAYTYAEAFTENGLSYVLADTVIVDTVSVDPFDITFAEHDSREVRERFGTWSTGEMDKPLYAPYIGQATSTFGEQNGFIRTPGFIKPAYGALAFKFDYHIKQYGGDYRMDTIIIKNANGDDKALDLNIPRITDRRRKTLNIADKLISNSDFSTSYANTVTTQMIGVTPIQKYADYAVFGTSQLRRMPATMVQQYGNPIIASYNNGPGNYEVEFKNREKRNIKVWFHNGSNKDTTVVEFEVDVLTLDVKNVTKFNRRDGKGGNVEVSYETPMEHMHIPAAPFDVDGYSFYGLKQSSGISPTWNPTYEAKSLYTKAYPYPVNSVIQGVDPDDTYDKYNIFAAGWINRREGKINTLKHKELFARKVLEDGSKVNEDGLEILYTGLQGAYALPATSKDGNYTLDFVNVIYIQGVPFIFDAANSGSSIPESNKDWEKLPDGEFKYGGTNFEPGDKLMLSTTGGALGLPAPGAKVKVRVGGAEKDPGTLEDDDLDAIKVVPNPYFISHQGQKSPYGAELFFTRLPEECTIDIYTVTGELVKRIEHNEFDSADPDKVSVDIWNLLSDNNQRVASQALVAVISTPNGAQTIKNFSVVVGSYRIITD